MLNEIKKAILSGIMISIGASAYLSCLDKGLVWLGAILFSAGLFTICEYGFNLYTGKVGYIAYNFTNFKYIQLVLLILVVNIFSTWILGILCSSVFTNIKSTATSIYNSKISVPFWKTFISGNFCGILMFLAVDTWKRGKTIGCFVYIPDFIVCGFDHSIADAFYFGAAQGLNTILSMKNVLFLVIVILGNAVGGMIVPLLLKNKADKN